VNYACYNCGYGKLTGRRTTAEQRQYAPVRRCKSEQFVYEMSSDGMRFPRRSGNLINSTFLEIVSVNVDRAQEPRRRTLSCRRGSESQRLELDTLLPLFLTALIAFAARAPLP
jgi:hypothetical protein